MISGQWTRRSTRLTAIATIAVGALIAVSCSSSSKTAAPAADSTTTTAAPIPAPKGLPAFYAVPQPLPTAAGKLIKSEKVAVPGMHGTVYRVMYVSQTIDDKPVAVTGLIIVPKKAPPADGYRVVTW